METLEISVVVPCFNEAGNVRELVLRLNKALATKQLSGEIVLVDDGSADSTAAVIRALSEEFDTVVGVFHATNQGIAEAWRSGVETARGRYVCLIDADLQYLPEDVPRLYREISGSEHDIVQGHRSSIGRLKDSRYLLSRGLNILLNLLFRMRLKDNKSGFVIARRDTLRTILHFRFRYSYPNTFIAVAAVARGYSIREIEVLFESRYVGKSYIAGLPGVVVAKVLVDLCKAVLEYRLQSPGDVFVASALGGRETQYREPLLSGWRRALFSLYFLTFPLHKWAISRVTRRYYEQLTASQWLSADQIRELQERKLRRLVQHAYRHVSYYRQQLDRHGILPDDIRTLDDLPRLPMLSKSELRENLYFDLMSDNHDKKKVRKIVTSGSTGEPMICYADQHQLEIRWASTLRSLEWTGYRFGDRQVRLWHQTIGMNLSEVLRERIDALLSRRVFIPAFELSDVNLAATFRRIANHRPTLIDGYAESLNYLAHYLSMHGAQGLSPAAVLSSAQTLTSRTREEIERAFHCRVFDKYGSREFSGIAYECDQFTGHHVVAESYIVEILKENGEPPAPGEMGEVVITDLNNLVVPFIRYRIGDLATAADNRIPCPCGRGLPRIGGIEGRVQSVILGSNGTRMPGTFFAHFFKEYEYIIRQYQVVQEEEGEIRLRIVKGARFNEPDFTHIKSELRRYLGEDLAIREEFVELIPLVRTGKHQAVISMLDTDFLQAQT